METYNGIIHELDVKGQIEYNDDLYSDTSNAASQLIRKTTNNIDFISVIAHNPYIHSLYNNVCKSNPIKFKSILRYPTCGAMLCTNAAQKWADIDLISSSLREFHFPVYIKPKLY